VLASELAAAKGLAAEAILPTHQGVDMAAYNQNGSSKKQARARIELPMPPDTMVVTYTGKLYSGYQEIEHLLAAARLLEGENIMFCLVGGRADHVADFRARAAREGRANVVFTGFVPPRAVPDYQLAADALVLYYPAGLELNPYRSPGKLFEYMAAGRPILAVDLPVLREVLGDPPVARMVPPDSPRDLASAILEVLQDPAGSERMAEAALLRVASFTWEQRARQILRFAGQRGAALSEVGP